MDRIRREDVDGLICEALPEFVETVRRHRQEWGAEPALYPLLGQLSRSVVDAARASESDVDLARRAYALVERAIAHGEPSVRDCFVIEFVEPLAGDSQHKFYPNLERLMGRATRRELMTIREWGRRYREMSVIIRELNEALNADVFSSIGIDGVKVRVIADMRLWNQLSKEKRQSIGRAAERSWRGLCGATGGKPTLEITGPRDTGFHVLWE
jgi:hypothetical protein